LGEELVNVKDLTPMEIQLTEADKTLRVIFDQLRLYNIYRKSKLKLDLHIRDKEHITKVKIF